MRPLLAVLPQFYLVLFVLAVGSGAGVDWPWVLATVCSLGLIALVQATRAGLELARRRRAADQWLLWGAAARPSSPLLSRRAGELTSPRLRSTLAHSLRRVDREVRDRGFPGPIPLNRRAIRCHLGLVRALQERLEDHSRPVSARGMLLVEHLITVPRRLLYSRVPGDVLAASLRAALGALDSAPVAVAA